jgi:tRNA threonylcarbamoyladenosine biosynthesis protein TsaB
MKLLAIETASEACSVALSIDGEVHQHFKVAPREHANLILPWVQSLLSTAGIGLSQLDALAFSRGPGSFTSLRIGIGVVQGLAWGADLPVVPVSSLQSAAQVAAGKGVRSAIVAIDARMNEVYCGTFTLAGNGLMQAVGDERVCPPGQLSALASSGWSGIGNGFERYDELAEFGTSLESVHPGVWPSAATIIPLAEQWLESRDPLPASQAQPVYIRDKVAQKPA